MVCCFTNLSCNKSLYSLGRRYNGNYALHSLGNNCLSSCMGYLNMESKKTMFIERYFACGIHLTSRKYVLQTPSLASTGRQSYLGNYNSNNFPFSVNGSKCRHYISSTLFSLVIMSFLAGPQLLAHCFL